LHLNCFVAFPGARVAASNLNVERKMRRSELTLLGRRLLREELSDMVPSLRVRGCITPRGTPQRGLVYKSNSLERSSSGQLGENSRPFICSLTQTPSQRSIQHAYAQGGLT